MPKQNSRTDWDRLRREVESDAPIPYHPEDGPYDPNDEEATERYLRSSMRYRGQRGSQKAPTKEMISIRLSREVVDYFRARGAGWQSQIDTTLKRVIAARKKKKP